MTPSDILNRQFPRGMNGYKSDEVNAFLAEVGSYAKQLERENAELTAKIEVLAEKVEEYRAEEESLHAALIGAQKLGDSVVKEAKSKAQSILDEAVKQADGILGDVKRNIELENYSLEKKKLEAAKFKTQLLDIYKRHIELINSLPYDEDRLPPLPARQIIADPPPAETEADKIESDVKLAFSEVPAKPEPDPRQKPKSRFGNLRFGEGFDPVRKE